MSPIFRFNAAVTLAVVVLVVCWAPVAGFSYPALESFTPTVVFAGIFGTVCVVYTWLRPDRQVATLMLNLVLVVIYMSAGIVLSYLVTGLGFPLVDPQLAAFDRAIGFDWPAVVTYVASRPWLAELSGIVYRSSMLAMLTLLLLLGIRGRIDRVEEFTTLLIVSGIASSLIAGPMAAAGAYVHYGLPSGLPADFMPTTDAAYMQDFFAIRDGTLRELAIGGSKGLVTFPSYHTIFSVMMVYVMRGLGRWFWLALAWNALIIASTPIDGGHHLADVLGGLVVAWLCIAACNRLWRRLPAFGSELRRPAEDVPVAEEPAAAAVDAALADLSAPGRSPLAGGRLRWQRIIR